MDPSSASSKTAAVDRVFSLLTAQDEITWQAILHDLVKKEGMDPWDIDVGVLAKRYIDLVRELKEHDFRLSGKVILAAAILLKIKSSRLVDEDISELDRLIKGEEEQATTDDLLFEDEEEIRKQREELGGISLIPRTPQPRKRKISIFDLVKALEKALEVKHRRIGNHMPPAQIIAAKKTRDITELIRDIYGKIRGFISTEKPKVMFSQLTPSDSREDKVHTFIPLLHLKQQRKIDLEQAAPFADIGVMYPVADEVDEEIAEEPKKPRARKAKAPSQETLSEKIPESLASEASSNQSNA